MDQFIQKQPQVIPDDGYADGGELYTDEEMGIMDRDRLKYLLQKCDEKVKRLNEVTGGKYKFSFGYIGNLEKWGDERKWMLFHRNDYTSIAKFKAADSINTEGMIKMCEWIFSLPEEETELISELKLHS